MGPHATTTKPTESLLPSSRRSPNVTPSADRQIMHQLGIPKTTTRPRSNASEVPRSEPASGLEPIRKPTSLEAIQLLTSVGQALSAEKDHDALMELILRTAKFLTAADGGTLYTRTADDRLQFEIMLTDSLGLSLGGSSGLPIIYPPLPLRDAGGRPNHRMVAARAAISGKTVNIPDAYDTRDFDFSGTREFDAKTGYRSKSFLTTPIKSHDDEVIGVLQLINAQATDSGTLRQKVVPFSLEDQRLVESLASQAGIALTNRRLMVELRQARDEAEQSSRLKSQFVANISHELRTPMTVIMGMTRLALETELDADQLDMLQTVSASANSLLGVLNDVLDFSKIEAGKLDLKSEPFNPREVVRDTLRELAEKAQGKGLELLCDIAPDVPQKAIGDRGRLRQVLVNLVGNAIKFTAKGEVTLTAEVKETDGDRVTVHFKVADTGCGVSSEKQDLIFDSFTQADGSTTRSHGGTGLGLSICKQLVGLMGGDIWVKSVPRVGSTFHFTARFRGADAADPAASPKELRGVRALVVDDHPKSLKITSDLLARWGLLVDAVGDTTSALSAIQKAAFGPESYRLVIADACMPGLSGFELAEEIRRSKDPGLALTPPGFVILLSAVGQRNDRAETCVQKPIFEPELREAIMRTLGYAGIVRIAPERLSADPEPGPSIPPANRRQNRPLSILVAEDSPLNQKLIGKLLANEGHHATMAANGLKALAAFERETFDLILMDVQMPELGGLETTREIRRRESTTDSRTPIIALTASAMKGDREQCLEAGMDAYVSKPLDENQLLRLILDLAEPRRAGTDQLSRGSQESPLAEPAASGTASMEVFDPERTLTRCCGKVEFALEIVDLFLKTADELVAELTTAIAAGDGDALHRIAHRLKGAATAVSGTRVEEVAQRLSEMGQDGELGLAIGLLSRLDEELDRLKTALLAFRDELSAQ